MRKVAFFNRSLNSVVLSGNKITEIRGLDSLKNLTKLSLSSNSIRTLPSLSHLAALAELRLNSNKISRLSEPLPPRLRLLDLGKNFIRSLDDVEPLRPLGLLRNLNLFKNPVASTEDYKHHVAALLPNLTSLDAGTLGEEYKPAPPKQKRRRGKDKREEKFGKQAVVSGPRGTTKRPAEGEKNPAKRQKVPGAEGKPKFPAGKSAARPASKKLTPAAPKEVKKPKAVKAEPAAEPAKAQTVEPTPVDDVIITSKFEDFVKSRPAKKAQPAPKPVTTTTETKSGGRLKKVEVTKVDGELRTDFQIPSPARSRCG